MPAWLGPERLSDPGFRTTLVASGTTLVRMPGGSWSNSYDWLACELEESGCAWPWAARPTDFADLLVGTGLDGMWTVSINETAEHSAAIVAFFNGALDDDRTIGTDRDGVDWQTIGHWAQLRASGGHAAPIGIQLWEVGNEVYGGRPEAGGDACASFGWEDVWTCDGQDYVAGDEDHDGYRAIRAAMKSVDPSIEVGAVGTTDPDAWGAWGREVVAATGSSLDFYAVHHYGFDASATPERVVRRPAEQWPGALEELDDLLPDDVPIAVTEHNLVAFGDGDDEATMTQAVNALFLSLTLAELGAGGAMIANQWDFASGTTENGTNYGLVDAETLQPSPAYFALALWAGFGTMMHHVEVGPVLLGALDVRAATRDDGVLTLLVTNGGPRSRRATLAPAGHEARRGATVRELVADEPTATVVRIDGEVASGVTDGEWPGTPLAPDAAGYVHEFPGWSVTLIEFEPAPVDG